MAPSPVSLADGPIRRPLEGHALLAPEGDYRVQRCPAALEPAVGQDARRSAVDFWKENDGL